MERTVVFVCLHGANKRRRAAEFFNSAARPGWHATSAGLRAQDAVSEEAMRLVAGTIVEGRRRDLANHGGGAARRDGLATRAVAFAWQVTDDHQ
jgi:hypothetical protein